MMCHARISVQLIAVDWIMRNVTEHKAKKLTMEIYVNAGRALELLKQSETS